MVTSIASRHIGVGGTRQEQHPLRLTHGWRRCVIASLSTGGRYLRRVRAAPGAGTLRLQIALGRTRAPFPVFGLGARLSSLPLPLHHLAGQDAPLELMMFEVGLLA